MSDHTKLYNSFREGLMLGEEVDLSTLQYRDIPEWDSVGHMALIAQIEDDFEVELTTEEVVALSNVAKAKEILTSHGISNLD